MNDLNNILKEYEAANNSHIWENVEPFICKNASYWFTDGSYYGIDEIKKAVVKTFETIQDEKYSISNIKWITEKEEVAICTYIFNWEGVVNNIFKKGKGRGTNIFVKKDNTWKILHEHLSS